MILDGRCGERQGLEDGAKRPLRLGRDGELVTSQLHGRYYELASQGKVFVGRRSGALLDAGNNPTVGLANPGSPPPAGTQSRLAPCDPTGQKVILPIRFEAVFTTLDVTPTVNTWGIRYGSYGDASSGCTVVDPSTSILPALVGTNNIPVARLLSTIAGQYGMFRFTGVEFTGTSAVSPYASTISCDFDGACLIYPMQIIAFVSDAGFSAPSKELVAQTVWIWAEIDL